MSESRTENAVYKPGGFARLPAATGIVDDLVVRAGEIDCWGWMFLPGQCFDQVRVYIDGSSCGMADIVERKDVSEAYSWLNQGLHSGFRYRGPLPRGASRLDLVGCIGCEDAAHLSTHFSSDRKPPQPPEELSRRVAGLSGPPFEFQGLRIFTDLYDQVHHYAPPSRNERLLDWGCGCGRVTSWLIDSFPGHVYGADIDPEAIRWCGSAFPSARFEHIQTEPPMPFQADIFEVVVGVSVFTHLSRNYQELWLKEVRRVLKPGGLFLASTHGAFAYQGSAARPAMKGGSQSLLSRLVRLKGDLETLGIIDAIRDESLKGIAPDSYYRSVYQSPSCTRRSFSRYFEIVSYIERGINGFQDLVVMRKTS